MRSFTSPYTLVLVLILLGYAFYFRATLPTTGAPLGQAEVSALFATDPYYLLYALLPAWVIYALRTIRDDLAFAVVIRSRTSGHWVRTSLVGVGRQVWPQLVLMVAVWFVAGLGYPKSWQWLRYTFNPEETIFSPAIGSTGLLPAGLAATTLIVFTAAAVASYVLLASIALVSGRLAPSVIVAVLLVVGTIMSHLLPHQGLLQLVAVENYLSPLASQTAFGSWWAAPCTVVAVAAVALLVLRLRDRRTVSLELGARARTALGVAIPAALVAAAAALNANSSDSITTVARNVFQGAGINGGTNLIALLFAAVVFLLPSFLYAGKLESELGGHLQYVLIRSHSFTRFIGREFLRHLAFGAGYLAGLAAVLTVSWYIARSAAGETFTSGPALDQSAYQFGVNGLLQLLFYWALTTLLVLITGRAFTGVIGLAAVIVLAIAAVGPLLVYLPLFANSLSHLAYGWTGLLGSSLVLILATAACVIAGITVVNRRGLATT